MRACFIIAFVSGTCVSIVAVGCLYATVRNRCENAAGCSVAFISRADAVIITGNQRIRAGANADIFRAGIVVVALE